MGDIPDKRVGISRIRIRPPPGIYPDLSDSLFEGDWAPLTDPAPDSLDGRLDSRGNAEFTEYPLQMPLDSFFADIQQMSYLLVCLSFDNQTQHLYLSGS